MTGGATTQLVEDVIYLLFPVLKNRMVVAPPTSANPSWRVFDGVLSAVVRDDGETSTYVLRGPDGKRLRQGVEPELLGALNHVFELLRDYAARREQAPAA